jgi:hypothetical protein
MLRQHAQKWYARKLWFQTNMFPLARFVRLHFLFQKEIRMYKEGVTSEVLQILNRIEMYE